MSKSKNFLLLNRLLYKDIMYKLYQCTAVSVDDVFLMNCIVFIHTYLDQKLPEIGLKLIKLPEATFVIGQ